MGEFGIVFGCIANFVDPPSQNCLDLLPHPRVSMPYLSPPTLTKAEHVVLLSASSSRDHLIFSLALGTGLRLAELVGLNVCDHSSHVFRHARLP